MVLFSPSESNDLVALMMQEYVTDKNQGQVVKGITKEEISGQGLIFYVAGQDTTNAAFNSAIYYLTHHPEWCVYDNLSFRGLNSNLFSLFYVGKTKSTKKLFVLNPTCRTTIYVK